MKVVSVDKEHIIEDGQYQGTNIVFIQLLLTFSDDEKKDEEKKEDEEIE